jgi:hypothetical protein
MQPDIGKKRRSRKKKLNVHTSHSDKGIITVGDGVLEHNQQRTQRHTGESVASNSKMRCHDFMKRVEGHVPGATDSIASLNSTADSTHQRLEIDLNSPAENLEAEAPPLPLSNNNIVRKGGLGSCTSMSKKKAVPCKRQQSKKQSSRTLPNNILLLDLNVLPLDCGTEETLEETEQA